MAIDTYGLPFLFAAKAAGVSFAQTGTLGRQGFFPDARTLQRCLDLVGMPEDARRLVAESQNYSERFLTLLGAVEICSIDNSSYEGAALIHDMNQPIPPSLKNRFTALIDGGVLEHIFNFPQAVANCMEMIQIGGHFIGITTANNFVGHGFYQFSPELFFRIFSPENGFHTESVMLHETTPNAGWFDVLDPEIVKRRVELVNGRPTYILIRAKKIRETPIFSNAPQQSDYSRIWEQHSAANGAARPPRGRRFGSKVRKTIKWLMGSYWAISPLRFQSNCYRRVTEADLVRGVNLKSH